MATYKCIKKSQVRAGFEMDSDKAGILPADTVIEAFEVRPNETGVNRVRYSQGWVSEATGGGITVLEKIGGGESPPAPAPADVPADAQADAPDAAPDPAPAPAPTPAVELVLEEPPMPAAELVAEEPPAAAAEELAPVSTATDDVAARIAELENSRTTQLARIESLETTITQLEETVAAMSTSASASVSEIAGLNAQLAAKDARIVELEAQVAAAATPPRKASRLIRSGLFLYNVCIHFCSRLCLALEPSSKSH